MFKMLYWLGDWYVFLKSSKCILHKLHIDGHKLGNKGLHVVDGLVPLLKPVLIEGSNLAQLCLQLPITVLHQLLLQPNKDDLECQCFNAQCQSDPQLEPK